MFTALASALGISVCLNDLYNIPGTSPACRSSFHHGGHKSPLSPFEPGDAHAGQQTWLGQAGIAALFELALIAPYVSASPVRYIYPDEM